MKTLISLICLSLMLPVWADCQGPVETIVVGDSQTGGSWSKSYFGNFLQTCLEKDFVVFGKGGSVLSSWLGKGNLDNVEIIQRDPLNPQLNIGIGDAVPLCKKRISPMLDAYAPKKILFFFGDNYIASPDDEIARETEALMKLITEKNISSTDCYFLTPTYEMQIQTKRNVPRKNLANTQRIATVIKKTLKDRCQHLDGLELMKDSAFYDGNELLKRILIEGKPGCSGAASNDNIHICGEAAKDLAQKVCRILNHY